jgi:hypothetical protein
MSTFDTNCMTEGLLPADDHIIEDDEHDGLGCRAGSSPPIEQGLDGFREEEKPCYKLSHCQMQCGDWFGACDA